MPLIAGGALSRAWLAAIAGPAACQPRYGAVAGSFARPARGAGRIASREKSRGWPRLGGRRPGLYAHGAVRRCREGTPQFAPPQWPERRTRGRSRRVAGGGSERRRDRRRKSRIRARADTRPQEQQGALPARRRRAAGWAAGEGGGDLARDAAGHTARLAVDPDGSRGAGAVRSIGLRRPLRPVLPPRMSRRRTR